MDIQRSARGYVGAITCNCIRTAISLDNVIPILIPEIGRPFGGPFTLATDPARLLPALVAQDGLEFGGTVFHCGMQPGLANFPNWGVTGYSWPYQQEGQSEDEPSNLWFILRGYSGSFEKVEHIEEFLRRHQAATWRLVRDEWDEGSQLIHIERACDGIYPRVPRCTDPAGAEVLRANRDLHARLFALVGHLDPDNIEILISTAPCPDPLSWDYP